MLAGMHSDAGRDEESQATLDQAFKTYPQDATF